MTIQLSRPNQAVRAYLGRAGVALVRIGRKYRATGLTVEQYRRVQTMLAYQRCGTPPDGYDDSDLLS